MGFKEIFANLFSNALIILGVVFVWRGVWVVLDVIDHTYFGGNDFNFALGLIALGLFLAYLHNHKPDEWGHF